MARGALVPVAVAGLVDGAQPLEASPVERGALEGRVQQRRTSQRHFYDVVAKLKRVVEQRKHALYVVVGEEFAQIAAVARIAQRQAEILRALREAVRRFLQLLHVAHFGAVGNIDVLRQVEQLAAGELLAEVLAGDIGDLVRLIEDHHVRFRDQLREAALFDDQIGEKQMVVNHHHVGVHRALARFDHKAIFVERAVAAEAVVVGAGHQRPDGAVFGDAAAAADIAVNGLRRPAAQRHQIAQRLGVKIAARHRLLLQPLQTEVVGASFQQGGFAGEI